MDRSSLNLMPVESLSVAVVVKGHCSLSWIGACFAVSTELVASREVMGHSREQMERLHQGS